MCLLCEFRGISLPHEDSRFLRGADDLHHAAVHRDRDRKIVISVRGGPQHSLHAAVSVSEQTCLPYGDCLRPRFFSGIYGTEDPLAVRKARVADKILSAIMPQQQEVVA